MSEKSRIFVVQIRTNNPLNFKIMATKSSIQRQKESILELLKTLNNLHKGISSSPRFTFLEEEKSIYIYGVTDDLLALHLVLLHHCTNICFYQTKVNNNNALEAYFI